MFPAQTYFALVDFGEVGKILGNNHVKLNKDHLWGVCDSSWIHWCFHWCSLGFSCKWDATGSEKTQWSTLSHVSNTNSFPCSLKGGNCGGAADKYCWSRRKHTEMAAFKAQLHYLWCNWAQLEHDGGQRRALRVFFRPNFSALNFSDWSPAGHFVFHYRLIVCCSVIL